VPGTGEHKDLSDPTFGFSDFWAQVTGGQLRWLATVLATAGLGLLVYFFLGGDAELYFPVRVRGQASIGVVGVAVAVWLWLAIANWTSWVKKRRHE
jgi:hypothetical protein